MIQEEDFIVIDHKIMLLVGLLVSAAVLQSFLILKVFGVSSLPGSNILSSDLAVCDHSGLECWQNEKTLTRPLLEADECGCK